MAPILTNPALVITCFDMADYIKLNNPRLVRLITLWKEHDQQVKIQPTIELSTLEKEDVDYF